MDRTSRRERLRAQAKYIEKCASCKIDYASKPCAATFTGTLKGKWVTVCSECYKKGFIDEIHGFGVYQTENKAAVASGFALIAPLLRRNSQNMVHYTPGQKSDIVAAFKEEKPEWNVHFTGENK